MVGKPLVLTVVADHTDPALTLQYQWMFTDHKGNERKIESNKHWKISWPYNNLIIDVSHVTDPSVLLSLTGYYSVIIYNKYEQKVINITLETNIAFTDIISTDIGNTDSSTDYITGRGKTITLCLA